MTYENINFKYPNMCVKDGYFYMFDHDIDALVQKVDDGTTAFTYPLDTVLNNEVKSLEYAGGYFWTLQSDSTIKKWSIDNYVCTLKETLSLDPPQFSFSDIFFDNFDDDVINPLWVSGGEGSVIESGGKIYPQSYGTGVGYNDYGPSLTLFIGAVSDFYIKLNTNFLMTATNQVGRLNVCFYSDTTEVFRFSQYDPYNGIYYFRQAIYEKGTNTFTEDYLSYTTSNQIELQRTSTVFTYTANGSLRHTINNAADEIITSIKIQFLRNYYVGAPPPSEMSVLDVDIDGKYSVYIKSDTFTVENYSTSLESQANIGDTFIYLNDYYDTIVSGTNLLIDGTVLTTTTVSGNKVYLDAPIDFIYSAGDTVDFYKSLWIFNNFGMATVGDKGSLIEISPDSGEIISYISDYEYKDVKACTFYIKDTTSSIPDKAVAYVKTTNLKFIDITNFYNVVFMTMDNIRTNGTTVIPVYDLSISNNVAYRLQEEGTYYGVDNSWANYNYQVSPIRRFVDSITVDIANRLLNCDGISTSEIISTVFDQFNDPIFMKLVFFEDDNDTGYMTISPAYTKSNGVAYSYYRAGVTPAHVTITATATQND